MTELAIVDYGLGNLRSVRRGLERAGGNVIITEDVSEIKAADGIILPGVGAFKEGVENAEPFRSCLLEAADDGTPMLGICLGMQMLLSSSEEATHAGEGEVEGLSLIPGRNVRFSRSLTVPHMGWNELQVHRSHPLVAENEPKPVDGGYAYFVHSYYAQPEDDAAVVATTDYGGEVPAIIANEAGNVMGTQFHPEKSGVLGLGLLDNFVAFCG